MKSRLPNRIRKPENDSQNVAFYKKRSTSIDREMEKIIEDEYPQNEMKRAQTSSAETEKKLSMSNVIIDKEKKTWASVASTPLKQEKLTIDPKYLAEDSRYDRIVVSPTKFNRKDFNGFVTCSEADLIRKEIKLDHNVHGTTYCRNSEGKLFITFKLVSNLTLDEVQQSVKKYFCINKTRNEGHHNKISGEVIHPKLEDLMSDKENLN